MDNRLPKLDRKTLITKELVSGSFPEELKESFKVLREVYDAPTVTGADLIEHHTKTFGFLGKTRLCEPLDEITQELYSKTFKNVFINIKKENINPQESLTMESLNIGPAPSEETPAQVGTQHYHVISKLELTLFKQQLIEELATQWPDFGCLVRFKTTTNHHDFGTYYDLDVVYNPEDPMSASQAFYCEGQASSVWSPERRQILNNLRKDLGLEPLIDPSQELPQ